MDRVIVTSRWQGLIGMQVCAVEDATDEEILSVCNKLNPAGTTNGWTQVVRQVDPNSLFMREAAQPVQCESYPDRKHFIVLC